MLLLRELCMAKAPPSPAGAAEPVRGVQPPAQGEGAAIGMERSSADWTARPPAVAKGGNRGIAQDNLKKAHPHPGSNLAPNIPRNSKQEPSG